MYKSRVETFNQVHYFHHLIFLFILQDDMKNKLQYFICMPEQKYRGGKWRQNSIVSVVMILPQVAGPASSCPIGERLCLRCASHWFHLSWFSSRQIIWRKGLYNRMIQGQRTNTSPPCHWNDITDILSIL